MFSFSFLFTYQLVFRHCHIVICPVLPMSAPAPTLLPCPYPPPRRHFCPVCVRLSADTPVLSVSASAPTLLSCPCPPSRQHTCPVCVRLRTDTSAPLPPCPHPRPRHCSRPSRPHTSSPSAIALVILRSVLPRPSRSASPPIRLARPAQLHRLPSGSVVFYNWNTTPLTKHHSSSYRNILIRPPHSTSCHVGPGPYPQ